MKADNNDTEALIEVIVYEPVAVGEGRRQIIHGSRNCPTL